MESPRRIRPEQTQNAEAQAPQPDNTAVLPPENTAPRQENQVPRLDNQVPRLDNQAPRQDNQVPRLDNQAPRQDNQVPRLDKQAPRQDNQVHRPAPIEQRNYSRLAILFSTLVLLAAIVLFRFNTNTLPVEIMVTYPRLAHKHTSDECRVISDEELLAGFVEAPYNVNLRELAASLRYHARANDWPGLCAQHLLDVPPLCFCVLLVDETAGSAPPDVAYIEMANLYIWDESDEEDLWFEDSPFCGEQYKKRHDTIQANYRSVGVKNGVPVVQGHNPAFANEMAATVQGLVDVLYSSDICAGDDNQRLVRFFDRKAQKQLDQHPRVMQEYTVSHKNAQKQHQPLRLSPQ